MGDTTALGITWDYSEIYNLAGKIYDIRALSLHHNILGDVIFLDDVDRELCFHEKKEFLTSFPKGIAEKKRTILLNDEEKLKSKESFYAY